MNTEDLSIDIPKGKVFVMGDNRNHSLDSRKLGYFDFDNDVIGKVFFKIPLQESFFVQICNKKISI